MNCRYCRVAVWDCICCPHGFTPEEDCIFCDLTEQAFDIKEPRGERLVELWSDGRAVTDRGGRRTLTHFNNIRAELDTLRRPAPGGGPPGLEQS